MRFTNICLFRKEQLFALKNPLRGNEFQGFMTPAPLLGNGRASYINKHECRLLLTRKGCA